MGASKGAAGAAEGAPLLRALVDGAATVVESDERA
ncbi:hypothetical protein NGA_0705500, partial [Nannochloropsis gaditana CCMP526]